MLVDTGVVRRVARIGAAIRDLGRAPGDVRAIVVTHLHRDHTGALAEVKSRSGAEVWMHPADAALVRQGVFARPLEPGPGLVRSAIARPSDRRPAARGEPWPLPPGKYKVFYLPADGYEAVARASFTVTM